MVPNDFKFKTILFFIIFLAFTLRAYKLNFYPPGLHLDEAALGYNAYSILKTTKDEHGQFLPVSLRSFGDWKPPLSSYLMIPGIWLFGLNEWTVRLPSAVLGTLTVMLVYFLVKELFHKPHKSYRGDFLGIISSLLLAISPWHLHQSRMASESNISLFFLMLGVYFLIKLLKSQKNIFLFLSCLFFAFSIYTYHNVRLTAPLLIIVIFFIFKKEIKIFKKKIALFFIVFLLCLIPLLITFFYRKEIIFGRAKAQSIFQEKKVSLLLWEAIATDEFQNPLLTRILHNKPLSYLSEFFYRYFQEFNFNFLFLTGDPYERYQIPQNGLLYLTAIPFFFSGIFFFFKEKQKWQLVFLGWLIVSPVVASFSILSPNSTHILPAVIPFNIILAYGLFKFFHKKRLFLLPYSFLLTMNIIFYLWHYYVSIPYQLPHFWAYGYKSLVGFINQQESTYQKIIVSSTNGQPYIFFLFYQKYPPEKYFLQTRISSLIDKVGGYEHVDAFWKYEFRKDFNWQEEEKKPGILYIGAKNEIPLRWPEINENQPLKKNILKTKKMIYYPNGELAFRAVEVIDNNY